MKLLAKSEVAKAKAVDIQRERAEGLKLAKRVDALREVAAAEESSLNKYRAETLAQISAEIKEKTLERDKLIVEVARKQEELRIARIPLNKEWESVRADTEKNKDKEEALEEKERELKKLVKDVEIAEICLKDKQKTLDETLELAEKRLAEATNKFLDSDSLLRTTQEQKSDVEKDIEFQYRVLEGKQNQVRALEKDVEYQKHVNIEERQKLDSEWRLFRDRQAMLERTINRNKQ